MFGEEWKAPETLQGLSSAMDWGCDKIERLYGQNQRPGQPEGILIFRGALSAFWRAWDARQASGSSCAPSLDSYGSSFRLFKASSQLNSG
jgi:hypothetical protein